MWQKLACCLAIWVIFLFTAVAYAGARDLVVVVKSREAEPYDIALKNLRRTLRDKGVDAQIEEYLLPEDNQGKDERLAELKKKNPQLFVTLGSAATERVSKAVKDSPVLFCMVLNPAASGFIRSMNASGNNLTGASLDIPPQVQFEALRSIVPNLKRIGVIYNPQETEKVVQQARKVAKEMGLEGHLNADKYTEQLNKHASGGWELMNFDWDGNKGAKAIFKRPRG